jgi:uncharacterized membrane protein
MDRRIEMKNHRAKVVMIVLAGCATGLLAETEGPRGEPSSDEFTIFDVPQSTTESVIRITDKGSVVGAYLDAGHNGHGFIHHTNGSLESIDVPKSIGTTPVFCCSSFTAASKKGDAVAGILYFAPPAPAGFVWSGGAFSAIDTPYTLVYAVNDRSEAVGTSGRFCQQLFVRDTLGNIENVPEISGCLSYIPLIGAINDLGVVAGVEWEPPGSDPRTNQAQCYGFLRDRKGEITRYRLPGGWCPLSISQSGLNNVGEIAGTYCDANNCAVNNVHGFIRDRNGRFRIIDFPNSSYTSLSAINSSGDVVGFYVHGNSSHGFLQDEKGGFVVIEPPGARNSSLVTINDRGDVAGSFTDTNGQSHLFIREHREHDSGSDD